MTSTYKQESLVHACMALDYLESGTHACRVMGNSRNQVQSRVQQVLRLNAIQRLQQCPHPTESYYYLLQTAVFG